MPSQLRDVPSQTDASEIVSYVMQRVKDWREYRDSNYKEKWREYYRLWRGIWDPSDKLRDSERSRLISPAIQQAVEATVAELEEATFGRDVWFDIKDDVADQQTDDIEKLKLQLKEDLEKEKWKPAIAECFLNGAIYGTAIAEILVEEKEDLTPSEQPVQGTTLMARGSVSKKYTCVKLRSVSPFNFCIDPGVQEVDVAHGAAIDDLVPTYLVKDGIKSGMYKDIDLGDWSNTGEMTMSGETRQIPSTGVIKLTKYYGKVPLRAIQEFNSPGELEEREEDEDENLVEAIVVIANDGECIKAVQSPYMMQDRPVVAYQHDRVPDRFWGRGVVEKGYNAQKALDTELRARADALALNTHPMMGVDATRLPRGMKPKVQPGLTVLTNGNPKDILMPFTFGNLNPVSYKESAELERMITMATGAMDSAAPTMVNPRNNTSSGMSMMMGASIKRQKRTLANFQDCFLVPAIEKAAFRYMQFDPTRYPVKDYKFIPSSTMGIMAREYEQQQLIQLLSITPPESPVWMLIMQNIMDHSSAQNRDELVNALKQMEQQIQQRQSQPPPPDPAVLLQAKASEGQNQIAMQKLQQEDGHKQAEFALKAAELNLKRDELNLKRDELQMKGLLQQAETAIKEMDTVLTHQNQATKTQIEAINNAQDNATNKANDQIHTRIDKIEQATKEVVVQMPKKRNMDIKLLRNKDGKLDGAKVIEHVA